MAWVRFPDGSRRKVERVEKADAQADLDELVTLRAQSSAPDPARNRQATFAEVIEAWFAAGCPNVSPSRTSRHAREKSPNTIANARQLLGTSVLPKIGSLKVDRTTTRRLEELFESMVETHATSTIDRNWNYLNQALQQACGIGRSRPTRRPTCCCRRSDRRRNARASRSTRRTRCSPKRFPPTRGRRCG
jgi:hypothetical protein